MKKFVPFLLLALGVTVSLVHCTPGQRSIAKSALDVAQVACLIANAELGDADVRSICDVADDLIPDMKRLLGEQRKAVALKLMSANRCQPIVDAGRDAR